jgi:hypothetical protein
VLHPEFGPNAHQPWNTAPAISIPMLGLNAARGPTPNVAPTPAAGHIRGASGAPPMVPGPAVAVPPLVASKYAQQSLSRSRLPETNSAPSRPESPPTVKEKEKEKEAEKPDPSVLKKPVKEWSVKDVINWLKLVDFGMYTPKFEEEKVDGELLITLKEEDLINEMKIDKPLHRKRLVQKISNLGTFSFILDLVDRALLLTRALQPRELKTIRHASQQVQSLLLLHLVLSHNPKLPSLHLALPCPLNRHLYVYLQR